MVNITLPDEIGNAWEDLGVVYFNSHVPDSHNQDMTETFVSALEFVKLAREPSSKGA